MEIQDSGLRLLTNLSDNEPDWEKVTKKVSVYEKRTGENFEKVVKDFKYVHYWDDGSFMLFNLYPKYAELGPTNCRWQNAWEYLSTVCMICSIPVVYTRTNRNYKAYVRLTHSEFVMNDGDYTIIKKDVN